jgi:flagella basal body P-ring formation protein FlgA
MTMRNFPFLLSVLVASVTPAIPNPAIAAGTDSNPAPAAAPLTQDDFAAALARDLAAHFNLEGDLQVELPRAWAPPNRVAHNWQVQLAEYPALPSGSMLIRCRLVADGTVAADDSILLHASLWRDVWLARQPLGNGTTFDPSLLDVRRVDLLRERDVVPAAVGDRTFIFTRSIQAGRLLTWRDLGRRPLVRKGDLVEVSASEGMLTLSMKGLAMQNGAMGEAVTVRNVDSRKDFTAIVVEENHVQVRF